MEKGHFSVKINAPKEKVWDTALGEKTYPLWTDVFNPGSHVEGDWSKGSKILFLGPDEQGQMGGMVSRIAENKEYEFLSIEHIGMIHNGVEDTESEEVKKWTPAFENYTLTQENGVTEFTVDMDINESYMPYFENVYPAALEKLKELAETDTLKGITVSTYINAPMEKVWKFWNEPAHVTKWCFASEDWEAPYAENDLKVDGKFKTRMSAKDNSAGFDFEGVYTRVDHHKRIDYVMADGRKVSTLFTPMGEGVHVTETFEMENENSAELQRQGWQAILDNFKNYVESNA